MTLDSEDVELIVAGVLAGLGQSGIATTDSIKADTAKVILGVSDRQLNNLVRKYPELKPHGKGSHFFSRSVCVRVAMNRKAKRN